MTLKMKIKTKTKTKTKTVILLVVISVLCIVSLFMFQRDAVSVPDGEFLVSTVQRGDLAISIQTIGVLDAAKSHMVSSDIRGNKGKIIFLINDGSWVEKGDVLVRLDPSPFEEEVHRLQGKVDSLAAAVDASKQLVSWEKNQLSQSIAAKKYDLQVAKLELKRLVKGDGPLQLAQYQEEMTKAKVEFERYSSFYSEIKKLKDDGFNNPSELVRAKENAGLYREKLEAAKRRLESYREYVLPSMEESARAKVENSQLVLEQSKKAIVYKIATVSADLNQAKAHHATVASSLRLAQTELANTVIKAPFSGIAILYAAFRDGQKRKPREGDTVLMNQAILYLPDISQLIVRTKVREVDLYKLSVGQAASVRIDAYPDVRFDAKVEFIGALASENRPGGMGGKFFQVVLDISGKDLRLRPGMTARVLIKADRMENVLLLPVQAVFQDENGKSFCYQIVTDSGSSKKTVVSTGLENELQIEILAGLQEGDRVSMVLPSTQ